MNRTRKRPNTVPRRPKGWNDWDRDIARLARGDGVSLDAPEELASFGIGILPGSDASRIRGRNKGRRRMLFRGKTRHLPAHAVSASH